MKTCSRCRKSKAFNDFHSDKRSKDGHARLCKVCACERSRQWREQYPERARKTARDWRVANRDHALEQLRIWQRKNKERMAESKRQWREKNKDKSTATARRWYQENKELTIERSRAWREDNLEKARAIQRATESRRRSRMLDNDGEHDANDVARQYEAQKGRCYYAACGYSQLGDDYHVDHVIPLSRGGSNGPENIVVSCPSCNLAKGAKLPAEWPQGNRLI